MRRLIILFLLHVVSADLPIHATIDHVKGQWKFVLSPSFKNRQSCGSGTPNNNRDNLLPQFNNYEKWMEDNLGAPKKILNLELSNDKIYASSRSAFNRMYKGSREYPFLATYNYDNISIEPVSATKGVHPINYDVGKWTMVYTEGFEVEYGGYKFFAFIDYTHESIGRCKLLAPSSSDAETPLGETVCYKTNPSKTRLGWYSETTDDGTTLYGCFAAYKADHPNNKNHIYVSVPKFHKALEALGDSEPARRRMGWKLHETTNILNPMQIKPKNGMYPCKTEPQFHYKPDELPKNFSSVPNPFTHDSDDLWPTVIDQKNCGACYAIASTYALQTRAYLWIKKLLTELRIPDSEIEKTLSVPSISPQSVLSCSFYNQGCTGGFPFLVGKWATQFGLHNRECIDYAATEANVSCPSHISKKRSPCNDKVYAKHYGYVGGCYECSSELAMMYEIYYNGPIIVAIDANSELMKYKGGIFSKNGKHFGSCEDPKLNGWEYTDHALAIVGWGEEPDKEEPSKVVKYWILRNSWGPNWGIKGYLKMLKGQNLNAVEAQAVYIDPDLDRGVLKSIISKYQSHW